MSIYFGWNRNDGIGMNPSRIIRSIISHINSLNSGTEMQRIVFRWDLDDGIPPRNIGVSDIFGIGMSDFSNRS